MTSLTNLLYLCTGFDFSDYCDGPYAEYPLSTKSGGYTGGSPGADRVIYDTNDNSYCGAVSVKQPADEPCAER